MSAPYIISRAMDPVFAVSVGVAAAIVRINREEKEKGHSTQQSLDSLSRRWNLLFEKEEVPKSAVGGKSG